jgi:F0F1-type ATP synthase assembly protein I
MRKKPEPAPKPTANKGGSQTNPDIAAAGARPRQQFLLMTVNMSWQLALVVLVPVIGGVELDKTAGTTVYTFIGLALALAGSALVMWRAMRAANKLPVPKLSAAQKRAIRKSYEAEDDD